MFRTFSLSRAVAVVVALAGPLAAIALWRGGASPELAVTTGLGIVAVGLWASTALPPFIVSLGVFLVGALVPLAPLPVVFAGFATTTFWLMLSGFVLGAAFRDSGLAGRLAGHVNRLTGTTYPRAVVVVVLAGAALAFVIPSASVRIVIFAPIAVELARRFGFAPGERGYFGLVFAAVFGTTAAGYGLLPANVANLLVVGMAETLYGLRFSYSQWFVLMMPVIGLGTTFATWALVMLLFPARAERVVSAPEGATPLAPAERRLLAIVATALLLWITDSVHHVSPAWVGLGAAILCLLPRLGVIRAADFAGKVDWGFLVFVAGALSYAAMVQHGELSHILGRWFVEVADFAPGEPARTYALVAGVTSLAGIVLTPFGAIATISPLERGIAEASGLPILSIAFAHLVGMMTIFFPYQAPQIMLGLRLGEIPYAIGLRFYLLLGAVLVVFLHPLNFLWWRLAGVF